MMRRDFPSSVTPSFASHSSVLPVDSHRVSWNSSYEYTHRFRRFDYRYLLLATIRLRRSCGASLSFLPLSKCGGVDGLIFIIHPEISDKKTLLLVDKF